MLKIGITVNPNSGTACLKVFDDLSNSQKELSLAIERLGTTVYGKGSVPLYDYKTSLMVWDEKGEQVKSDYNIEPEDLLKALQEFLGL